MGRRPEKEKAGSTLMGVVGGLQDNAGAQIGHDHADTVVGGLASAQRERKGTGCSCQTSDPVAGCTTRELTSGAN